jgi:hypothetical protein
MDAGILSGMAAAKVQKVTVHIDRDLLRRARERTGKGVTATVREGLELVAAGQVYDRLRALRGKVAFSLDLRELRKDRR